MTSERVSLGRRARMLDVAAEARIILSSSTDQLQNSIWPSKTAFLDSYPCFSEDRPWNDDDQNIDLMALIVLDDVPHEVINEILRLNTEVTDEPYLWLADTPDSIPDWKPNDPAEGSSRPVSADWRSPFSGASVEEVAIFIQGVAKPTKPLCKRFFAVLQKQRYEQDKQLLIYKIIDTADSSSTTRELQAVPCPAHLAGFFFVAYERYRWDQAFQDQALYFGEGGRWSDDDAENQLMALVVLDEFPVETINKILDDNIEQAEHPALWLADSYSTLPDYLPNHKIYGTEDPIDDNWRSPFAGKSIEDAANFVRNAPKPPKPLCKQFFAVLQKDRFEQNGTILICKILSDEDEDDDFANGGDDRADDTATSSKEVQRGRIRDAGKAIVCKSILEEGEFEVQILEAEADYAGTFFLGGNRYEWEELLL